MGQFGNKRLPRFMEADGHKPKAHNRAVRESEGAEILSLNGHGDDHALITIRTKGGEEVELQFNYDGEGLLHAEHNGESYSIPVEVEIEGAEEAEEVDEIHTGELKKGGKYKYSSPAFDDDLEFEDEVEYPKGEPMYKFKGKGHGAHLMGRGHVDDFVYQGEDELESDELDELHAQTRYNAYRKADQIAGDDSFREKNPLTHSRRLGQAFSFSQHVDPNTEEVANRVSQMFGPDHFATVEKSLGGPNREPFVTINFINRPGGKNQYEYILRINKDDHHLENNIGERIPDNIQRRLERLVQYVQNNELNIETDDSRAFESFATYTIEEDCPGCGIEENFQVGMSEDAKRAVKTICEELLIHEAHQHDSDENPDHTYESYLNECNSYMAECMMKAATNYKVQEGLLTGIKKSLNYDTVYSSVSNAFNKAKDHILKKYPGIRYSESSEVFSKGTRVLKIKVTDINRTDKTVTVNGKTVDMDDFLKHIDGLIKSSGITK